MKLQTLVTFKGEIEDPRSFLREHYPERFSLIENWGELDFRFRAERIGEDRHILIIDVDEGEFEKLRSIFPSREDAMGAFITTAREAGWEEVPDRWVIYHAQFEDDKLIAGLKTERGIFKYNQLRLEEMIQTMMSYPRVVVYSSDVLTYIKDLFPDVDQRAYVVAREIAKKAGEAPSLEDLGRIYGVDTTTLEGKLKLIEKLLTNPVRLPKGEVNIKPVSYPLEA